MSRKKYSLGRGDVIISGRCFIVTPNKGLTLLGILPHIQRACQLLRPHCHFISETDQLRTELEAKELAFVNSNCQRKNTPYL